MADKAKEKEVETRMGIVGQGGSREAMESEVPEDDKRYPVVGKRSPCPQKGWKDLNVCGLQRFE